MWLAAGLINEEVPLARGWREVLEQFFSSPARRVGLYNG